MSGPAEREIERLEQMLDRAQTEGDEVEVKAILADLRDLERDIADRDRWEEEGQERGWWGT